jgi:hypothetical protein
MRPGAGLRLGPGSLGALVFFLETGSHYAVQVGLELTILLPQCPALIREHSSLHLSSKLRVCAGRRWLTSVTLATQQTEIKRIEVQSQHGQIVFETLSKNPSQKKPITKKGWWSGSSEGSKFKLQYRKKAKNQKVKNPEFCPEVNTKIPLCVINLEDQQLASDPPTHTRTLSAQLAGLPHH